MSKTEIHFDIYYEHERVERILMFVKDVYEKLYPMGNGIFDNFQVKTVSDDKGELYFEAYIAKCSKEVVEDIINKIITLWEYQCEVRYNVIIETDNKVYEKHWMNENMLK